MCSADQCNSNHSAYSENIGQVYAKMNGGYDSLRTMMAIKQMPQEFYNNKIGYNGGK